MESFFDTPAAQWPRLNGRLHLYTIPDEPVTEYAELFQHAIVDRGIAGLSIQHRPWLHMTIEIINRYADELSPQQFATLTETLDITAGQIPAFELTIGPALAGNTAITLDATPDAPWQHMRDAVRGAITATLGQDAVPARHSAGRPHITLGYALSHFDIQPHLGWLAHRRHGRAVMTIRHVHLLAVHQDPVKGLFTWDHLHQAGMASQAGNVLIADGLD